MKNTKVLNCWTNDYGNKIALAVTNVGSTPKSKNYVNHYRLTLLDINDVLNEVNELSSEDLDLDSTKSEDDIWLEAMLSWGEFISSKNVVKCELNLDQHDLIDFCINNTLRKTAAAQAVSESNFEVLTWFSKINSSSKMNVAY